MLHPDPPQASPATSTLRDALRSTRQRLTHGGRPGILALGLVLALMPLGVRAQDDKATAKGPRADIRLALHQTSTDGPTEARGWAAGRLQVGDSLEIIVGAGLFTPPGAPEPRCMSFANGMPFEALSLELAQPATVWELKATLEALEQDAMTLDMHWRRMEAGPDGAVEATARGGSRVTLRHGEHRVLDHQEHPDGPAPCTPNGLLARVEANYLGAEEMAHLPVRQRLWLVQERDGEEIVSEPVELDGIQGETLDFRFSTEAVDLGLATAEGHPASLLGRVRGSVTAWWHEDHLQLTVLDTRIEQRLLIPQTDAHMFASGSGAKRFEARPGEVIEVEIPVPQVSVILPAEGLQATGELPTGLELDREMLRIDGRRLLEGLRLALRLEVLDIEPAP